MMKKIILLALFCASLANGQSSQRRVGEIKHISGESYYVNLGGRQNLKIGDEAVIVREGQVIAKLVVESVANFSSAMKVTAKRAELKIGDRVMTLAAVSQNDDKKDDQKKKGEFQSAFGDDEPKRPVKKIRAQESNHIRGNLGMRVVSFNDQDNGNLDYRQFGLRSRVRVERLFNTPLEFGFRWRSRGHQRERQLYATQAEDNWTHSLYEFGLTYNDPAAPVEFSAGRILSPYIRGVGYIDGGLFVYRLNHNWRAGITGGLQPNLGTSAVQSDHRKFGTFVNYTTGEYKTRRLSSSVAFSGSYRNGDVSREFVYWQNTFNAGTKLSLYQTVEFDMNRGWRQDSTGTSIQMSNLFLSASYAPWRAINFTLSYDVRKRLRTFETRSIPDSLFDEAMRRGLRGGVTVRLSTSVSLSGNAGIRFGNNGLGNTVSASSALNFRRFLGTRTSLSTRLSYFSTMFSSAFRPNVYVSVPLLRKVRTYVSAGGYLHDTAGQNTQNWWSELGGTWYASRLLFIGFGYKNYWQGQLQSQRFFLESGISF